MQALLKIMKRKKQVLIQLNLNVQVKQNAYVIVEISYCRLRITMHLHFGEMHIYGERTKL